MLTKNNKIEPGRDPAIDDYQIQPTRENLCGFGNRRTEIRRFKVSDPLVGDIGRRHKGGLWQVYQRHGSGFCEIDSGSLAASQDAAFWDHAQQVEQSQKSFYGFEWRKCKCHGSNYFKMPTNSVDVIPVPELVE